MTNAFHTLFWFSALFGVFSLSLHCLGTIFLICHIKKRKPSPASLHPISILKPMKGLDSQTETNLRSLFEQNYPCFEILFAVADSEDPVIPLIRDLLTQYPQIHARLVISQENVGYNPKVNNLMGVLHFAKYDNVLISDSNVELEKNYLRVMISELGPKTGVVTSLIAGKYAKTQGGYLERVYLNTFYARWMVLSQIFGFPCVVGKSMLFRRKDFERFGGLKTLGCYLAEDYMTGIAFQHLGYKVKLSSQPVTQPLSEYSNGQFWSRHIRWGRIRKAQAPVAFFVEPLFSSLISGLVGAWALSQIISFPLMTLFLVHMGVWAFFDFLQIRWLSGTFHWRDAIHWFYREYFSLPLWIHVSLGNSVNWRGQRLVVKNGGLLEPEVL